MRSEVRIRDVYKKQKKERRPPDPVQTAGPLRLVSLRLPIINLRISAFDLLFVILVVLICGILFKPDATG